MAKSRKCIFTVTVEGYTHEGDGVAHRRPRRLYQSALSGEQCEIKIPKDSKNIVYARLEKLLAPSLSKNRAAVPNFGNAAAADLLHMDYAEELRLNSAASRTRSGVSAALT